MLEVHIFYYEEVNQKAIFFKVIFALGKLLCV